MNAIKRCRPLLGTFVEIEICDAELPERVLGDLAEIAFGRIARVQSLMSFSDPASELSRLNACGHLHPLSINAWTRDVIAEAQRLGKASEGVFDIAVAPTTDSWGLLPHLHVRQKHEEEEATFRDVILHHDGRVSFRRPLRLDVGGLAKGFAMDKAAEILVDANVGSAKISAGGDLRYVGKWPKLLSLRDPTATAKLDRRLSAKVTGPAVATRAAYFANRCHHWRKSSHILHPLTQKPMRSNVSVSVFAQSCVQAEALTKVVLLDEPDSWKALLKKERATAVFVTAKGEVVPFLSAA
ncbi:FAD:protein FMN transferase [Phragmitibacter flavus]|uniref:FAD:protein FMN transferase n=1 Tax=Phragmitibacter flavus TaxID=2576071 RepID=A0A5R8K8C4_9BACT|nr:FAD:protein FMN transferase [Phragmitibacter flavus]TLD68592.1 FAD:protein FMN transferase [Phragmitibacter flavus]